MLYLSCWISPSLSCQRCCQRESLPAVSIPSPPQNPPVISRGMITHHFLNFCVSYLIAVSCQFVQKSLIYRFRFVDTTFQHCCHVPENDFDQSPLNCTDSSTYTKWMFHFKKQLKGSHRDRWWSESFHFLLRASQTSDFICKFFKYAIS